MMLQKQSKKQSVFDSFRREYRLSKTLRFELEPVGRTEEFIRLNKVFEKDQTINDSYNQAKFYFDMYHQEFIESVLKSEEMKIKKDDFKRFADTFYEQNKIIRQKKSERKGAENKEDKKDEIQKEISEAEKKINEARRNLYKQIKEIFDEEACKLTRFYGENKNNGRNGSKNNEKKDDNKSCSIEKSVIFSKDVINILKEKFPKDKDEEFKKKGWPSLYIEDKASPGEKVYIFEKFDKFTTYLTKFQKTRKNLYASGGESTSVITRVVSNFEIFLRNKEIFDEKYSRVYSEIKFPRIDIFEIDYYLNCLTQNEIDRLGKFGEDETSYNKIIGEINKRIKEYRDKQKKEKNKFPLFVKLKKQILGKVEREKELIEKIEGKTEEEVFLVKFREFIETNKEKFAKAAEIIKDLTSENFKFEYGGIYLKRAAINTISRRWFSDYRSFLLKLPQTFKNKEEKSEPKIKKFISLEDIKNAVNEMEGDIFKEKYYKDKNKGGFISSDEDKWKQFLKIWRYEFSCLFEDKYENFLKQTGDFESFSRKKEEIAVVENYCDSALKIYQMMKYFNLGDEDGEGIPTDLSTEFYSQFNEYYEDFEFMDYYKAFRNYLTKKPYTQEKIKLSFGKGNLLGGFSESPEGNAQYGAYIFRKDGQYFLGITTKNNILDRKKFPNAYDIRDSRNAYQKMEYYQLKSATICGSAYKGFYDKGYKEDKDELEEELKKKLENGELKDEELEKLRERILIEKIKRLIKERFLSTFPVLKEIIEREYQQAKELIKDIDKLVLYKIKFVDINKDYIEKIEHKIKERDGEKLHYLYLFRIVNKDLNSNQELKTPNLHTLYFKNLFSEKNLENSLLALKGGGEIFYRPKSLTPAKEIRGIHIKKEIIKNKRYTRDKILFHLPIEINSGRPETKAKFFNEKINKFLSENENKDRINIIGIDRGERNLLYYCVINQKGQILEQGSLNEINGVNYFEKLVGREKERQLNRQSWQPIAKIKDLKRGYLSFVVRKICDLIEKYNAIVVLEDLNVRFKQIRSGIERTVYQQFEKALIDKLSYLVFKDNRDVFDPGGVLNGYQLVAPFTSFKDIGKQTGILFYTNAQYTSKTDPLTGFRKNIYISNSASLEIIKEAIRKFKAIGWDNNEESYYFSYNPKDFKNYGEKIFDKEWTVYSKIPRIRRELDKRSGHWEYKKIDLNKEFEDLFKRYGLEVRELDILPDIRGRMEEKDGALEEKKEFDGKLKNFYERFIYLFNIVLQLRNTYSLSVITEEEGGRLKLKEIDYGVDFIASPVKPFFTTSGVKVKEDESGKKEEKVYAYRNLNVFENQFVGSQEAQADEKLFKKEREEFVNSFDSDGVGAYNIARKGIIILNRIKENPQEPDLFITGSEWDEFVQNQWNSIFQFQK